MDRKTQQILATSEFQKYMLKNYLRVQLSGMIRVFRGRYPDYMTYDQMLDELKNMESLIENMDVSFYIPSTATNSTSTNPTTNLITNINSGLKPVTTSKPKQSSKVVLDADRCHARVWDATRLVWKLGDGRQVFGSQCKKAKMSDGSNYCKKHAKKLTHEDWFKEPSDTMRRHFTQAVNA